MTAIQDMQQNVWRTDSVKNVLTRFHLQSPSLMCVTCTIETILKFAMNQLFVFSPFVIPDQIRSDVNSKSMEQMLSILKPKNYIPLRIGVRREDITRSDVVDYEVLEAIDKVCMKLEP